MKVPAERAGDGLIFVGEIEGKIVGFFGFGTNTNEPEMTHLFVEPTLIGKGIGKKLWVEAIGFAREKGWEAFKIIADPFAAENFYLPMGAF